MFSASPSSVHCPWRFFIALSVLMTVLLRIAIPAGFMPSLQVDGAFKMVICTIEGAKTVSVDKDFNPVADQEQQHSKKSEGLCDFGINTAFLELPVSDAIITRSGTTNTIQTFSHLNIITQRSFGNASSRSPPFIYA